MMHIHTCHLLLTFLTITSITITAQIIDYDPIEHLEPIVYESLPGKPTLIQPIFSPDNSIHVLCRLIESATISIDVQNQYFYKFNDAKDWLLKSTAVDTSGTNPRPQDINPIVAALYLANERGVRIRIIIPPCPPGEVITDQDCIDGPADKYNAVDFFQSIGAEIRVLNNKDFYVHNKGLIIDQKIVVICSINFSETSLERNRESGVAITDERVAAWFGAEFQADWENSITVARTSRGTPSLADPDMSILLSLYPEKSYPPVRVYVIMTLFTTNTQRQTMAWDLFKQHTAKTTKIFHAQMYQLSTNQIMTPIIDMMEASPSMDASIIVTKTIVGFIKNEDRIALLVNNTLPNGTPVPAHVWSSPKPYQYQHSKFWLMDGINTTVYSGNWALSSMPTARTGSRNREWGVTITSRCINSIFEQVWQIDRKNNSKFWPPQGAAINEPDDCSFDTCGVCARTGVISTCSEMSVMCAEGASALGPFPIINGGGGGGNPVTTAPTTPSPIPSTSPTTPDPSNPDPNPNPTPNPNPNNPNPTPNPNPNNPTTPTPTVKPDVKLPGSGGTGSSENTSSSSSSSNVFIYAGVGGGVAALILVGVLIWYCRTRRSSLYFSRDVSKLDSMNVGMGQGDSWRPNNYQPTGNVGKSTRTHTMDAFQMSPLTQASYMQHADVAPAPASAVGPAVWVQQMDPSSGFPYYFNTVTQQTTWERPTEFVG